MPEQNFTHPHARDDSVVMLDQIVSQLFNSSCMTESASSTLDMGSVKTLTDHSGRVAEVGLHSNDVRP